MTGGLPPGYPVWVISGSCRIPTGTRQSASSGRERPHPERGGPMSQESNEPKMRPEYDIRGGVRGKYFDQYHERPSISIKFEASTLIVESTASAQQIGHVT